ncbi:MAG TPA: SDR family NAD(P)-dependent oxidoreductase [Candidatus Polarisedimenticolia bacterium]|nr:SDR family NAD(P)-dependent oxidoreductase [Candidatus Polarisedimenticolia bacterium]
MQIQSGQTVLLTGASGGLGMFMARALAKRGASLALTAYPGAALEEVRAESEKLGVKARVYALDLRDPVQRAQLISEVRKEFGPIDILVNNAGVEFTAAYDDLTVENITETIAVNLEAPMVLTRLVLPEMLSRKRGHIVNISSLAGKSGPAFQEPYAATKAGLVAFTSSLRHTYRGTGVSASAIVPGFVEAGIYADLKKRSGMAAPALLGTSPPEKVAQALIKAIEQNLPEIIINPLPVRPLLGLIALFPKVGEWAADKTGANDFFRKVVEKQKLGNGK